MKPPDFREAFCFKFFNMVVMIRAVIFKKSQPGSSQPQLVKLISILINIILFFAKMADFQSGMLFVKLSA